MAQTELKFKAVGRPKMPAGYGLDAPEAEQLLPWSWVAERMTASRNYWLATTRPDGRPHAAPVWGVWLADALYFGTDSHSVKGKNLAVNPAVVVHLESGDEVVIIEGQAVAVVLDANPNLLARLDEAYQAKYQMKLSEAGAEATIMRVQPQMVLAWLENDFLNTATRWQIAA